MANDEKIEGSIVKDVAAQMSYITTVNAFEAVTSGYPVIVTATFIWYMPYLLLSAVYVVSYFEPWSKVKIVASMDEPSKFTIAYSRPGHTETFGVTITAAVLIVVTSAMASTT